MITNIEGFAALGGHAAGASRAARRLTLEHEVRVANRHTSQTEAVVLGPSRGRRLLGRTGDLRLSLGAWLKAQSSQASLQPR